MSSLQKAAAVTILMSGTLVAANLQIPLWPHGAPGPKSTTEPERDTTTAKDRPVAGRPVLRLGNVTSPTLTLYRPTKENSSKTAVIVFPGGGYRMVAMDLEGTEICEWLNSIGLTAILVKYRVPEPLGLPRYQEPLQDAQRAVSIVRSHASAWGLNPERIGVLGFSAGGHLLAVLSQTSDKRTYEAVDNSDQASYRPDFVVLIYPAYLSVNDKGETLAPEARPSGSTPPMFIVQTEDDKPFIGGTLLYYRALIEAHVPAEMHIYSSGGHGYGLRQTDKPVTRWPKLAESWLRNQGLLK